MAYANVDIGRRMRHEAALYVVPNTYPYDIILGRPWADEQGVVIDPRDQKLLFKDSNTVVQEEGAEPSLDIRQIDAKD